MRTMTAMNTTIRRFQHGDFYIDIVDQGDTFEAWLQHKDYGISELMFGTECDTLTYRDFLDLVNDALEEYEETYYNEHIDECLALNYDYQAELEEAYNEDI